ncbi:hypothetical protein DDB_G0285209 [Dictyostelium discoideum AX4]|uniref:Uncharacterized protein n=1 Tax=Dictyostelium discoideum TaxID=44689 RepID=Q54NK9_DICDI|nr:hypothetical protein DDB_G0285209 [Dictyostelium discoideum AX4]EAL64861.1 hypothetical protein DDB_G0285209 [Dictyostelium discoideum AX4]|eukprot:XP_638353.1 hypothetical protein DDB_G0285209 [Dictyostelium discoideum AX4]
MLKDDNNDIGQHQPSQQQQQNNNEDNDDMSVGDLFLNKSYVKKTLEYFGVNVNLNVLDSASTDFDLTGQVIWPSAQVLTQYIIKNQEEYKNKKILEVGSGVGVCGLFLAKLGQPCTLSDNNEVVLDLLRLNVEESTADGYKCDCIKLDWGNQEDMDNCLLKSKDNDNSAGGFDMIIGSDIVYWKIGIVPLFKTVSYLLKHNDENSRFVTCYQSRSTQTDNYLLEQATLHGFEYEFKPIETFLDRSLLTFNEDSTISIINLIIFKRIKKN